MTKHEAVQDFKLNTLPFVRRNNNGEVDTSVADRTWTVYKTRLWKRRLITQKQMDSWGNTFGGDNGKKIIGKV